MPKTHKGYIVPFLLILVLLGFAGFVVFTGQGVEAPVVADEGRQAGEIPDQARDDDDARQDDSSGDSSDQGGDTATTTSGTLVATSTASTTLDVSAELE